jgi:anti-sigma factor RsiW
MNKRNQTHDKPPLSHIDTWEDMAMDYLDGSLSAVDSATVEAHLQSCTACRDAVGAQRDVMALVRAVPEAAMPPELSARILDALTAAVAAPAATDTGRRAKVRDTGGFQRLMDRLVHARWAPAAIALLVVAAGVAAWSGITSQTDRGTTGNPQSFAVTTVREDADKAAATSVQETVSRDAGETETGGATTTAAAATTTSGTMGTGSTRALGTTGTLVTSSLTTMPPQATTLINPPTTRAAGGLVAALGLTPVLLVVSSTGVPPARGIAQTFQEIAGMQPLPSTLWATVPTYAAAMDGPDLEAVVGLLRQAGLDARTEDALLVYGEDYLDRVASELGLSLAAGKDTLVIAVLSGG